MKTQTSFHPMAIPVIALLCAVSLPNLAAQDAPAASPLVQNENAGIEDPLDPIVKGAEAFVDAFNNKDAKAMAALFTPQGEIILSDAQTLAGRQEIEDYYSEFFAGENIPSIALEATNVEFTAPDVAIEDGLVHLTYAEDEPVRSFGYSVTHSKQSDGSWLMAASHSLSEVTAPAEMLKPLYWMIGEWTLESEDGSRIDMVIDLDERGCFLLGEALFTDAEEASQTTSMRIGWNPTTSSVYWWTFDSDGGNASGPWARRGDEWICTTTGVTADAEASASSQTLFRDGDMMVMTSTHRMLAGEAQPDLSYRYVRRAPDPISLLNSEAAGEPGEPETKTEPKPASTPEKK